MDGTELRQRRKALKLSQAELAERLGLSLTFIGMMERGEKPIAPRTAMSVRGLRPDTPDPGPLRTTDPVEQIVERGLQRAGLVYETGRGGENPTGLDFWIPELNLAIEVKRFHSDRIAEQMSRAPNVIAIQGKESAEFFATLLAKSAAFVAPPVLEE